MPRKPIDPEQVAARFRAIQERALEHFAPQLIGQTVIELVRAQVPLSLPELIAALEKIAADHSDGTERAKAAKAISLLRP